MSRPRRNERLHAALDAYMATHSDVDACHRKAVQDIARERDNDLSWTVVACVMAALEAAGVVL
jgi:hypothetical protein